MTGATNLDSIDDEVLQAEELAALARLGGEDDGSLAASAALGSHTSIDTSTAPTIDVVRPGIRSLLIAWDGVEAVHGHGYYEAQIDTDPAFGTPDDFYKGKSTFTVFDGIVTGTVYFARVRAVDAAGNTGPWSVSTGAQTSDPTGTDDIGDGAVTTVKIGDLQVTTAKIGDLQVARAKIADLAVNDAKIDNLAVKTAKIDDLAVKTLKIDNLAVTTGKNATVIDWDTNGNFATGFGINTTNTDKVSTTLNVPSFAGEAAVWVNSVGHFWADNGEFGYGYVRSTAGGVTSEETVTIYSENVNPAADAYLGGWSAAKHRIIAAPGATIACTTQMRHDATGFTWSNNTANNRAIVRALGIYRR